MSLRPPIKAFSSAGGRTFSVKNGVHEERWKGDSLWSDTFEISYKGKPAGKLFRSLSYGETSSGDPRWHATIRELYWSKVKDKELPRGHGYDVAAFDDAKEALAAWADSADQILNFADKNKK